MEIIEFTINGKVYTAEEVEGKYEIVSDSNFVGEMYKEKNKGWSWEKPEGITAECPWEEISQKLDKHIANLQQ